MIALAGHLTGPLGNNARCSSSAESRTQRRQIRTFRTAVVASLIAAVIGRSKIRDLLIKRTGKVN